MVMRQFFLYLSQQRSLRRWMETSRVASKLTERFIAGVTLDEATAVCQRLNADGMSVALDYLGENVTSLDEARGSLENYLRTMDRIAESGLNADVSIKITQFGVDLSMDACLENVRALAARAKSIGSRVEIDMESTQYTDRTLEIAAKIANEFGCVRCVIQAYLHRSEADIAALRAEVEGGRNPRDAKVMLAKEITARFHDAASADAAEQDFVNRSKGGIPDDIPEVSLTGAPLGIAALLKAANLVASNGEGSRMIEQGGVRIDGAVISDKGLKVEAGQFVLQVGKRKFARVTLA